LVGDVKARVLILVVPLRCDGVGAREREEKERERERDGEELVSKL